MMDLPLPVLALLFLLPMIPTFWAIVHVMTARFPGNPLIRFAWLGLVTFLPVIGAVVYFIWGRPKKVPEDIPGS